MKRIITFATALAVLCSCGLLHESSDNETAYEDPEDYVSDGFSTSRKEDSTGSISRVVPDDNISAYPDILSYLEGRVAGVTVENGQVFIRGNEEEPLFIVDGIEVMDVSFINPNDVRSVDVLKGPEASIYGSKGMNGVIVISTKRGDEPSRGERRRRKAKVELRSNFGFSKDR